MHVRTATPPDATRIREIQKLTPLAATWDPFPYSILVAEEAGGIAGFLVWRQTASDEIEILNLAVDPLFQRRGLGHALVSALAAPFIFLEVRASNLAARALYRAAGYLEVATRPAYYHNPVESAIVMRLQS